MKQITGIENQNTSVSFFRCIICKILIIALITTNFLGLLPFTQPVQAQQVPIVITADQPNVWTLEQAHYLLAQMHRRNLDLKAKNLEDLDANAINGIRIDILKTLLEVGVNFNDKNRFTNSQAKDNLVFNSTRRQELIKRQDELNNQSLALTEEIAKLNIELAKAETEDDKNKINNEIQQKNIVQTKVDKQITQTNDELKTLNPPNTTLTDTSASANFNKDKQGGLLDESFKAAAKKIIENADNPPKLNASLQLDNFLQLQYEIISKQLTLLRDEVGPGERLVFLELPQSINASYDKANNKWAQSWWKIRGYTRTKCIDSRTALVPNEIKCPAESRRLNRKPQSTTQTYNSILNANNYGSAEETYSQYLFETSDFNDSQAIVTQLSQAVKTARSQELYDRFLRVTRESLDKYNEVAVAKIAAVQPVPRPSPELIKKIRDGLNYIISGRPLTQLNLLLPVANQVTVPGINADSQEILKFNRKVVERIYGPAIIFPANDSIYKMSHFEPAADSINRNFNGITINNISIRQIRTVELIPRQSSLNVNDIKLRNKTGVLNIVASFLFGLGVNLNFQRQREQFAQFVQQELYSSAFGKGSREFGWTFTPMPGTDRLLSGVRTTYAVVVVPQEATSLILDSGGCYFRRSDSQPQDFSRANPTFFRQGNDLGCSANKAFIVPIPGAGNESNSNDFYISGLAYNPVSKDKRITVSIYGENFSSQIGVLVDGVPLKQSIGLAQPFIRDDSITGEDVKDDLEDEEIQGNFERVDAQQIVATFEVPDLEGTPTITLVAPGIAIDVNRLDNLYINGTRYTSLEDSAYMFGKKPADAPALRIDNIEVFSLPGGNLNTLIYGAGLDTCSTTLLNGLTITPVATLPKLIAAQPTAPTDELLKFTLICNANNDIIKSSPVKNPLFRPVLPPPIYDPTKLRIDKVKFVSYENSILVVELEGIGFTNNLGAVPGQLVVQSPTSATLLIPGFTVNQVVTFTDSNQNLTVRKIITRNPPPKTKVTETVTEPDND